MIYITGTTRGLGKELAKVFSLSTSNIVELNRPEFDIKDPVIHSDFDIYINNAHDGYSQTELLYKLFDQNKDRNCQIINIGSVSADGDRKSVNPYAIQKKSLDSACTQLQLIDSRCRVIHIKPGRMNTDMIKHMDVNKMGPRIVAEHIYMVSCMSWGPTYIKTITIDIKEI